MGPRSNFGGGQRTRYTTFSDPIGFTVEEDDMSRNYKGKVDFKENADPIKQLPVIGDCETCHHRIYINDDGTGTHATNSTCTGVIVIAAPPMGTQWQVYQTRLRVQMNNQLTPVFAFGQMLIRVGNHCRAFHQCKTCL